MKSETKGKKKLREFVIDRAKWARGGMGGRARLLNDEGNMCCLGFACLRAHRKTKGIMLDRAYPSGVGIKSYLIRRAGGDLERQIAGVNDAGTLSPAERESTLRKLFAVVGLRPIFKGRGYPKEPKS